MLTLFKQESTSKGVKITNANKVVSSSDFPHLSPYGFVLVQVMARRYSLCGRRQSPGKGPTFT